MDESVSVEEAKVIEEHIKTCATCRHEYELLCTLKKKLDLVEMVPVPDNFSRRVLEAIEKNKMILKSDKSLFYQFRKWALISAAAAIILLTIFSANVLGRTLYRAYAQRLPKEAMPMINVYRYTLCAEIPDSTYTLQYLYLEQRGVQ
jgi:predicted anti-sigma-YlaC factor YlaD